MESAAAEGIEIEIETETEAQAQAQAMRAMGCSQLQGFRFGRPCSPASFAAADDESLQQARA